LAAGPNQEDKPSALQRNVCARSVQLSHPSPSKTHTPMHILTHRHYKDKRPKALWHLTATRPKIVSKCVDATKVECVAKPKPSVQSYSQRQRLLACGFPFAW